MFANLPTEFFESDALVQQFLELLRGIGPLVSWVLQPVFGQCLVVFECAENAMRVKQVLDRVLLPTSEWDEAALQRAAARDCGSDDRHRLRVYLHHATPLVYLPSGDCVVAQSLDTTGPFLAPPAPEREFLISPPGSPPVGWEPREEDRPNTDTLAEDLIEALTKLVRVTEEEAMPTAPVLLVPPVAVQVPGVVLEEAEPLVMPSSTTVDRPAPTARPPLPHST